MPRHPSPPGRAASPANLTAAQLAEQTGVPPGTLRVWAARYGFPVGERLPGGHRRYSEDDADAIRAVQRLRHRGLSMTGAIDQVRATKSTPEPSIYAALRRRRPELRPFVMSKAALLQLCRAIEDEHSARAGSGLLVGSFQHERHYRASERRWTELARPVKCAVALADFASISEPPDAPIEIPLPAGHQLGREWTLITDSPEARACVSAWELAAPHTPADRDRRFEVVWSFDSATVADAALVAVSLIKALAPGLAERIPQTPSARLDRDGDLLFGGDLAARAYAYLAGSLTDVGR